MRGLAVLLYAAMPISLLTGCAGIDLLPGDYRKRDFDAPGAPPALRSAASERENLPPERLRALTLDDARALALQRNHTAAAAAAAVEASEARIIQARAAFLPSASVSAQQVWNQDESIAAPDDFITGRAAIRQSVYSFGRNREAFRAARADLAAGILDERSVRQELLFRTTDAWYRMQNAIRSEEVAREALEAAKRQFRDAETLLGEDRITKDELLTAKVNMLESRQTLVEAGFGVNAARRALNALLALPADAPTSIAAAPAFARAVLDPSRMSGLAKLHNPGLLAIAARQRSLEHRRNSLVRQYAPEIVAGAGVDYTEYLDDEWNAFATLGVEWSLFAGGGRIGQIAEVEAQRREVMEQERQAAIDLAVAIEDVVEDVREQESAFEVAREAEAAAEESYRIIYEKYRAGRETAQRVLEAQASLSNSKNSVNRARFFHGTLLAQLEFLVGLPGASWNQGIE